MATYCYNLLNLHLIISCFVFVFPFANSVYFHISRFAPNDNRILYQGDAKPFDGVIEFNYVDYGYRVGWATYTNKVPLWNSKTGKLSDFTTRFTFTITIPNLSNYGHGFAFFLALVGSQIPPNSAGALLGLFNTTNRVSTLGQVVLVEFDTFKDPWDTDGLDNHVGINNNLLTSANYTSWNAINHSHDIADALPEWVMVGFSGSIAAREQHILQSWEFYSTLVRKETNRGTTRKMKIVIASVILVTVLIAVTVISYIIFQRWKQMKRKTAETANLTSIDDDLGRGAGPRRFSYIELVSATNNVSEERKLGEGGFGAVHKGLPT
ncbi:hypothetical protein REPUB_Repub10bG0119000 [Reevesia pubescens]